MNRMQEEAVRRAREMQSRARFPQPSRPRTGPQNTAREAPRENPPRGRTEREESPGEEAGTRRDAPSAPAPPVPEEESPLAQEPAESAPNGLLESLFKDKEKTIILALLILLGSEGGNHELMFALMFLLM